MDALYLHLPSPLLASEVELGSDTYSNCHGEVPAGTGITGWYQLVPRTMYVRVYIVCI